MSLAVWMCVCVCVRHWWLGMRRYLFDSNPTVPELVDGSICRKLLMPKRQMVKTKWFPATGLSTIESLRGSHSAGSHPGISPTISFAGSKLLLGVTVGLLVASVGKKKKLAKRHLKMVLQTADWCNISGWCVACLFCWSIVSWNFTDLPHRWFSQIIRL